MLTCTLHFSSDEPVITCTSLSAQVGDIYAQLRCNVPGNGVMDPSLLCHKITWLLGNMKLILTHDEEWRELTDMYGTLKTSCEVVAVT